MNNKDKNKLNLIAFCGFITLIALLVFVSYMAYWLIEQKIGFNGFNFNNFFNVNLLNKLLVIIPIVVYGLFDFILVIMIWSIKWETKWCKNTKFIFGVLSLLFPFIFSFVFSSRGKLKMKDAIINTINANKNNYKSLTPSYPINMVYQPQYPMNYNPQQNNSQQNNQFYNQQQNSVNNERYFQYQQQAFTQYNKPTDIKNNTTVYSKSNNDSSDNYSNNDFKFK
ncbi:MAG: hypothetical protein K2L64_02265 [Ureaplasma sp.]|nr:hypothetical protein [Ureaplasma sp.]